MNNCLVTTLKAAVNDNSLLRMGEMRIKISSIESPNRDTQSITLGFDKRVDLEIIGEGYFTDATLSANNGKKMTASTGQNAIYFSNGNYEIAILDKYSLNYLQTSSRNDKFYPNKAIDLKNLKYLEHLTTVISGANNLSGDISALSGLTNLTSLSIVNSNLLGDISALSGLTSLTTLNIGADNLSGDISVLSSMTSLTYLNLAVNNLSGDISVLSSMTSLKTLSMNNNKLSGDISVLSGLTSLKVVNISNNNLTGDISALNNLTLLTSLNVANNPNISGDISSLSSLTLLESLRFGKEKIADSTKLRCSDISAFKSMTRLKESLIKGINIQGDLSLLPASLIFLSTQYSSSHCSWDNSRPSSSNIFAIEGGSLTVDNIDGMLNDFSNCVVPSSKPSFPYYSIIDVLGSRTSASDAAVSSLKSKGYTIKVNGVVI